VGASAPGIGDRHTTPVSIDTPGVEVQATLIAGALAGHMPYVPWHAELTVSLITLLVAGAAALVMPRLGAAGIVLMAAALLLVLQSANALMFGVLDWITPVAAPMMAVVLIAILNLATGHFIESKARQAVVALFGQYVSPKLVQRDIHRRTVPTAKLWGNTNPDLRGELMWRITMPVSVLILALLALPLSYMDNRSGRSYSLLSAIGIFLLYQNGLTLVRDGISSGKIPLWPGLIVPHLLMLMLAVLLLRVRSQPSRPFWQALRLALGGKPA